MPKKWKLNIINGTIPVADLGFSPGGGGAPTPKSAIIFQFCPRKLHENERIWTPGGARVPGAPLRSANAFTLALAKSLAIAMPVEKDRFLLRISLRNG